MIVSLINKSRRPITCLLILLCISCNEERRTPVYVDLSEVEDIEEDSSSTQIDEGIQIPFREENGVKYVTVKVNGIEFEMIFDTGCAVTLISVAEANYLYQKGKLTNHDILGTTRSVIADGSIVENMVVHLDNVIISNKIECSDVQAIVSNNVNAPLLLGNDVLNRLAEITIDNQNKVLHFRLKKDYE